MFHSIVSPQLHPLPPCHLHYRFLFPSLYYASAPLFLSFHISCSASPPCSLSLSGSLPSVCLCAWGAGCYLDDLVREGERDFISCLPEGLWYLWCYKAALLKKARIRLWRSTVAQRVKVHPVQLAKGSSPRSGCAPLGLWYLQCSKDGGFIFQDMTMMNIRDQQVRVHCEHKEDANLLQYERPNPLIPYSWLSCLGIWGISRLHFLLWVRLVRVGVCLWASGIYGAITQYY